MTAHAVTQTIVLRDGRQLAWLAVGPARGVLVVYLHGAIGSPQVVCPELEAVVSELGIRYVMVSRPGFGESDPLPGRTLRQFAGDVAQLADALGHVRFAVVGVSAGGPYALACAHELPRRIAAAGVVSCMLPGGGPERMRPLAAHLGLCAVRAAPRGCAVAGDAFVGLARRHPALLAYMICAGASEADRRLLAAPDARELAAGRFLAATRGGVAGMIDDHVLCSQPWDFEPARIHTAVQLWHGLRDPLAPAQRAIELAACLPRVRATLHPEEGHFFYRRRLREILGAVVSAPAPGARSSSSVDQPKPRAPRPCPVSGW